MLGKFYGYAGVGLRSVLIATLLLLCGGAAFSQDFTDASGQVTVRIYTGPWVFGQHNTASVSVDNDFVLVGGGAEVLGQGNPGALLTASYPDTNLTTWYASSKDHERNYSHYLRAYAIGLRLAGLSSVELRSHMVLVTQTSTPAQHPNAIAALPPGYLLVGGGARANWSGSGILLTESYPSAFQWVASAKDHWTADFGTVDAFAIGVSSGDIPGFGFLSASYNSSSSFISTGYGTASISVPTGWVPSSIGGQAQYSSVGRMLTQIIPFSNPPANSQPGSKVTSKDHMSAAAGYTSAYVVSIKKQ